MHRFFHARSVAVVGVSNSPDNLGRAIVYNLLQFRYEGCIYLVGPKGGIFLGHKIYRSIAELPEPTELAAVLVPAAVVPEVLEQCGRRGIRRVVVESAGFAELGDDRKVFEEQLHDIINRYQMRVIGPNCIGVINRYNGLAVPFMPFEVEAPPGRVGVISQSGGVGAMMINGLAAENIGFSKFASIGNKLDVNENDLLEYLAQDDKTAVVFCYLEGIADGRRLMKIAAASPKPIVVHKSNTGRSGATIARSHSASLSSDDRVVDAALKQSGILRVRELPEALLAIKAFHFPSMKGNRLAVISRSGGHAVMAADAAEEYGFSLPPYPQEIVNMVRERSRAKVIQLHNPMDLGDLFDLDLYHSLAEHTLERQDIDGLLFIHNYQGLFDAESSRRLLANLAKLAAKSQKPLAICVFTTNSELAHDKKLMNWPVFSDPREAVRALAINRDKWSSAPLPVASMKPAGVDTSSARSIVEGALSGMLSLNNAAVMLSAYGVDLIPWEVAQSEEKAVEISDRLGYPVVLKTAEPKVIHKTEADGVYLDLRDAAEVRTAYRKMLKIGPSVLVQKMSESAPEWIVGGRRDEQFGPVIMVGLGGVYVEVFKDTTLRVAPVEPGEAERMLDELRSSVLLEGFRGSGRLDRKALVACIVRVSWLLADLPQIEELDLNPVRVYEQGCCALDWRIAIRGR